MKIFLSKELTKEQEQSIMDSDLNKIYRFFLSHSKAIIDCGAYIKTDNFILCFEAMDEKSLRLFVLSPQFSYKGENFIQFVENSQPKPFEFSWEDIEQANKYSEIKEIWI